MAPVAYAKIQFSGGTARELKNDIFEQSNSSK
jgi:hypothetical protein